MTYTIYLDTSAIIKEYVDEISSDLINRITDPSNLNKFKLFSSIWSINEMIGVIDRLSRRKDEKGRPVLSNMEIQRIFATFADRIKKSGKDGFFSFVPINHAIVSNSRLLILDYHLSPNDALHLYTAHFHNCDFFLIHDKHFIKGIPEKKYKNTVIIDLANKKDTTKLQEVLNLS